MNALGVYFPRDSVLQRLAPGGKLLALALAAIGSLFLRQWWQALVALAVVALLYAVARIPLRVAFAQLRPVLWLAAAIAIFQVITGGWQRAVLVVGALVALIMLAALLSLTTRTTDLIDVVVRGCRPLRRVGVDPERVGLVLALAIRSVSVIVSIAGEVRDAQRARGSAANPRAFAVPLVVRSLRHAEQLGEALAARGLDD